MAAMRTEGLLAVLFVALSAGAQVPGCKCDPLDPASLAERQCALTREALAQPPEAPVFFLKDTNPRKPNRWLALPRAVRANMHTLADMTRRERTQLWTGAIGKARELWGDRWGLAINADRLRTQCHPHIHIGRLLPGVETGRFIVVSGPEGIPVPRDGSGLWVHPHGRRLHVHLGEQLTETVLLR